MGPTRLRIPVWNPGSRLRPSKIPGPGFSLILTLSLAQCPVRLPSGAPSRCCEYLLRPGRRGIAGQPFRSNQSESPSNAVPSLYAPAPSLHKLRPFKSSVLRAPEARPRGNRLWDPVLGYAAGVWQVSSPVLRPRGRGWWPAILAFTKWQCSEFRPTEGERDSPETCP